MFTDKVIHRWIGGTLQFDMPFVPFTYITKHITRKHEVNGILFSCVPPDAANSYHKVEV